MEETPTKEISNHERMLNFFADLARRVEAIPDSQFIGFREYVLEVWTCREDPNWIGKLEVYAVEPETRNIILKYETQNATNKNKKHLLKAIQKAIDSVKSKRKETYDDCEEYRIKIKTNPFTENICFKCSGYLTNPLPKPKDLFAAAALQQLLNGDFI